MRLNKFIADNTNLSRRKADQAIEHGRVKINDLTATLHSVMKDKDRVYLDNKLIANTYSQVTVVLLDKPVGYVCSKDGQGSPTVYDLLPKKYHHLNIAGRLDKDSSGLVILTNDGDLLNKLTHPKYKKDKVYEIELDKSLNQDHKNVIKKGVELEDGISKLTVKSLDDSGKKWRITMHEGRNRQIRRTFAALNYSVTKLHRTKVSEYKINGIMENYWKIVNF